MAGDSDRVKATASKLKKRFTQDEPVKKQVDPWDVPDLPLPPDAGDLSWAEIDGLNPRIFVSVGGTVPAGGNYRTARGDIGLEIDKSAGITTEEIIMRLSDLLGQKWEQLVMEQADRVDGVHIR